MPILRIEHPVPDFDAWRKTFDSDPLDRKASGVHRYRVLRPADDPNYAIVDLEFDTPAEAEAFQGEGLIGTPQGRILEVVETTDL